MEKKIVKNMLAMLKRSKYIKKQRIELQAIYYGENFACVSDSRFLLVYYYTESELKNKSINFEGKETNLQYPNVDIVLNQVEEHEDNTLNIDFNRLYLATQLAKEPVNGVRFTNVVLIGKDYYDCEYIRQLLQVMDKLSVMKLYFLTHVDLESGRKAGRIKLVSPSFKAMLVEFVCEIEVDKTSDVGDKTIRTFSIDSLLAYNPYNLDTEETRAKLNYLRRLTE